MSLVTLSIEYAVLFTKSVQLFGIAISEYRYCKLKATGDSELAHHPRKMNLNRVLGDTHLRGDGFIRMTLEDQLQNSLFCSRKSVFS